MTPPMHIPWPYTFTFLYLEPVAALGGTYLTLLHPFTFLHTFSPLATPSTYSPLDQPIYDQLAAHLLRFAYCEAVLLRATTDIRVWKHVLFGMFLCDCLHLFSAYCILGPAVFFDPRLWRVDEWVNFVMLYGPGSLRLALCLGLGLKEGDEGGSGSGKKRE